MKNKTMKRIIAFCFAVVLALTSIPLSGVSAAEDWNYKIELVWSDGTTELVQETTSRAHLAPTYSLVISTQQEYPEESIEIRLPYAMLSLKYGNYVVPNADGGIGLAEKSNPNPNSSFTYYIDTKDTDSVEDDEIVIYNYQAINNSLNATVEIAYDYEPTLAYDFCSSSITATAIAQYDGQEDPEELLSNTITYKLDHGVEKQSDASEFATSAVDVHAWTDDPALSKLSSSVPSDFNTSQYNYVLYKFTDYPLYANQDVDVAASFTPNEDGQVLLAGIEYVTNNYLEEKFDTMELSDDGTSATYAIDITEIEYKGDQLGNFELTPSIYALVAYPKKTPGGASGGQTTTEYDYSLQMDASFSAADEHEGDKQEDDKFEVVTESKTINQHYVEYSFNYGGNIYFGAKQVHAYTPSYFANASIDALKAETDAAPGFVVMQGTFGFAFTEGYRMELLDDHVYLSYTTSNGTSEKVELTEGDYYFTNSGQLNIRFQYVDKSSGEVLSKYPSGSFLVQGRTADSSWETISTHTLTESNVKTVTKNSAYGEADLTGSVKEYTATVAVPIEKQYTELRVLSPEGLTDYFFVRLENNIAIRHDSAKIQKILEENDDLAAINVTNISTNKTYLKDDSGNEYVHNTSSTKGNNIADEVGLYEDETEGAYFYHYNAEASLKGINAPSTMTKNFQIQSYDQTNRVANGNVRLSSYISYTANANMTETSDKFKEIISLNHVVFYDLLPHGWHYDTTKDVSIASTSLRSYTNEFATEVEVAHNFNGTGRDLVTVKVDNNSGLYNMNSSSSMIGVNIPVVASYDDISSGTVYKNIAATQKNDGSDISRGGSSLSAGYEELSTALTEGDKNTLYANASATPIFATSYESGAMKTVLGDGNKYTSADTTTLNGSYSWKLQLSTDATSGKTSNIKFMDILETAGDEETSWKGVFDHVDLSFANMQGIYPVVYYATVEELTYQQNEIDMSQWSTNMPEDKSEITGILVDFGDYVMDGTKTMYVEIFMTAPSKFEQGKTIAKNDFAYQATITAGGAQTTSFNHVNSAQISYLTGNVVVNYETEDGIPLSGVDEKNEEVPESKIIYDEVPVTTPYDTTESKPTKITTEDGRVFELVPDKTKGEESGEVVQGTTEVTYVYREVKGSVVIHYVDENGNSLQDSVTDTENASVGTEYDTTDHKPETITKNGEIYILVPEKTDGVEIGKVVEGTTEITYVYRLKEDPVTPEEPEDPKTPEDSKNPDHSDNVNQTPSNVDTQNNTETNDSVSSAKSAGTGDRSIPYVWSIMLLISVLAIGAIKLRKKNDTK